MILPAQMIRAREGMITPFEERAVFDGMSYGLSAAGYDVRLDQDVRLEPGGFVLASTLERFEMPMDLIGIVHDKSSWARRGIAVQNTVLESGWIGFLTLELSNHGSSSVSIRRQSPVAQLVFHLLAEPTKQPYSGKYQHQQRGPQRARNEE